MTIRIVTDSACDLPAAYLQKYNIHVVPLFIHVGEQSFRDGIDMDHYRFYSGLDSFKAHPYTAAPGPAVFTQAYEEAGKHGDEVLAIHVAGDLSTTLHSAQLGAREARVPVSVHDSGQLSLGAGLQVLEAAEAAAAGLSVKEILETLNSLAERTHIFAILDTLKYLERSGRVNLAAAGLGAVLRIKPIIKMHANQLFTEKISTQIRAIQRLLHLVEELGPLEHLSVVHTNALQSAEKLYQKARHLAPGSMQPIYQTVTPVIGAHIGPNGIGLVCVRKQA